MGRRDWLAIAVYVAMFFVLVWFRGPGHLWNDEVMGWTTLAQPTWREVMRVWWSGVDSSGFFFYVFARPWLQLLGWTEYSLHAWSTTMMSLSFLVIWVTARRFAPFGVVAVVVPLVFLDNRVLVQQFNNGRTYGVLMLAVGLCCWLLLRTDPREQDGRNGRVLAAAFAILALLLGSHTLGMLFWGVFLSCFALRDLLLRRIWWPLYGVAVLALAAIVPLSWRNIQADIEMGKPTFWTPLPTARDFLLGFGDGSREVTGLLVLTIVCFLVVFYRRPATERRALIPRERLSIYCLLLVSPLLTVTMFGLSLLGKSIFIDRYLMPVSVGNMLLLAELFTRIRDLLPVTPALRRLRLAAVATGALLVVSLFVYDLRRPGLPGKGDLRTMVAALPGDQPIVITDVSRFIETIHAVSDGRMLLTPTDWKIQLDPDFGGGGASFLHEMEDWRKMGIYADHILETPDLLAKYPRFLVIADAQHTLWLRRYLVANPAYRVERLPDWVGDRVWSVERR